MFKENAFHSKLHEIDHDLKKYDSTPSSSKSMPHSNSDCVNFSGKISEGAELADLVHHVNSDGIVIYLSLELSPMVATNPIVRRAIGEDKPGQQTLRIKLLL